MPGIGEIAVSLLAGLGQGELKRQQTRRMMDRQSKQDAIAEDDRKNREINAMSAIAMAAQRGRNKDMYNYAAKKLQELTGQQFSYQEPEQPTLYDVPEQYQDIYGEQPVKLDQLMDIRRTETGAEREKRLSQPKPKTDPKGKTTDPRKTQIEEIDREIKRLQSSSDKYRGMNPDDEERISKLLNMRLAINQRGQIEPQAFINYLNALRKPGFNTPGKGATKQQRKPENDPLGLFSK